MSTAALEAQVEFLSGRDNSRGTTGEIYLMSPGERELVAVTAVKKATDQRVQAHPRRRAAALAGCAKGECRRFTAFRF